MSQVEVPKTVQEDRRFPHETGDRHLQRPAKAGTLEGLNQKRMSILRDLILPCERVGQASGDSVNDNVLKQTVIMHPAC